MGKKFDLAGIMAGQKSVSESGTVTMLPIDRLISDERNFYSVDDVQELMDSIAVSGVLQPILVAQVGKTDAEGWRIIAGHRRAKAVSQLQEEWTQGDPCPYDRIPAIVRPAPTNREEELLEELALITTNSAARKLKDAEIARQAERMQELFYALKKEGYEFPGRMRTQVAKAVGVSESKLARLKVIREKLIPQLLGVWEAGNMPEYTAEALCKLPDHIQRLFLMRRSFGDTKPSLVEAMGARLEQIMEPRECTTCAGEQCSHGKEMVRASIQAEYSFALCPKYSGAVELCCRRCLNRSRCETPCQRAVDAENAEAERRKAVIQREEEALKLYERKPETETAEPAPKPEQKEHIPGCMTGLSESGVCGNRSCAENHGVLCCEECQEQDGCNSFCGWLDAADEPEPGIWYEADGDIQPLNGMRVLILRNIPGTEFWRNDPKEAVIRNHRFWNRAADAPWSDVRYWCLWPLGGPEEWKDDA